MNTDVAIATATVEKTFRPLRTVYSRLNYYQWLEVCDLHDDSYAEEKWQAFQALLKNFDKLGTLLPKLVAAGESL